MLSLDNFYLCHTDIAYVSQLFKKVMENQIVDGKDAEDIVTFESVAVPARI